MAGGADLTGNTGTELKEAQIQSAEHPDGRQLHFGIREHGMGGIMTGIAMHGGGLPVGGTFLTFSDYMRGAVRLAALSEAHVVYSWTHDSVGLGEDGPDASTDRASRRAAGHAWAAGRASGRRERDRRGVAHRRGP